MTRPVASTPRRAPRVPPRPKWLNLLGLAALALFGVGLYLALVTSPADINQGDLIRVMYAHVSVAWICFLAVFLTALFGSLFLWSGRRSFDVWALANAELALVFAALTLVGGMTYSRPTLNTWWTWDAKLTLTALLFALLVGYFIVRGMLEDPDRRGRVSAVVSIIAAASLPFNYFAANWFRTLHPAKSIRLDGGGVTMDGSMLQALLVNVAAAALIYLFFMVERARVGRLEAQLETEREKTLQSAPQEVIHV
ncbi:cytochrome c biogenesis protein CcsA [Truepera radiovictrix]|uniref:Heme exporter protein C n=1 Tax=Truepera radiovictrix (strain DSM 17093 / CIP 108686 / LMG 22925 / RQ-24) TaxID=649638 RepID=D7CRR5_TRURR|nr:cytochrome c biogenesis protein CcsA [Truepera radiovictrix]ADI13555.1 cytochrome c assembly protein [Truepera radiovictrix DSM 17093]WMT57883.1 cytochrome c biogenesis protein CcsA [Truepera radiovictrix]